MRRRLVPCASAAALVFGASGAGASPAGHDAPVLVILPAHTKRGNTPAGLDRAAALPGATIERVDSSELHDRMPCCPRVLAGSRTTVAGANTLAATLHAVGDDHTLKLAGRFVGPLTTRGGACGVLSEPAPSGQFDAVFGQALGVSVPAAVEDRGPLRCPIQGWVLGVEGTPHFGWQEGGLAEPPLCGPPELIAELDGAPNVVVSPAAMSHVGAQWKGRWASLPSPPDVENAEAVVCPLDSNAGPDPTVCASWSARKLQVGLHLLYVAALEQVTGDGQWMCGGRDLHALHGSGVDGEGKPRGPLTEVTGRALVGRYVPHRFDLRCVHLHDTITGTQAAVVPSQPDRAAKTRRLRLRLRLSVLRKA